MYKKLKQIITLKNSLKMDFFSITFFLTSFIHKLSEVNIFKLCN